MKLDARFVTSAAKFDQCPTWDLREIAMVGRSNVGKSSLINALTGMKGLARTSKTPGRTQSLNFFTIADDLALVDLPGYGYAKIPADDAQRIARLMRDYLTRRANLALLVLVIDIRRGPQREELTLAEMVRTRQRQMVIAATKADKLGHSQRAAALRRFAPLRAPVVQCSALDGEGLEVLRRGIVEFAREAPRPPL